MHRTLVLTSGAHLVSVETARRIIDALESNEKLIVVPVDVYSDGTSISDMTLVLSHVVGLLEHSETRDPFAPLAGVSRLRSV